VSQNVELKSTIALPKTDFPMKADLPKREPVDPRVVGTRSTLTGDPEAREGKPSFVFHDGPPYANNNIHLGQGLNKILKDFVVKSRSMMG
jgi:isoleucyl-tRNA synthetase